MKIVQSQSAHFVKLYLLSSPQSTYFKYQYNISTPQYANRNKSMVTCQVMVFIWGDRGYPAVRFEYKSASERYLVTEI